MSLIDDDAAVLGQQEIFLQLPQQYTICHELQSSALTRPAIVPYLQSIAENGQQTG